MQEISQGEQLSSWGEQEQRDPFLPSGLQQLYQQCWLGLISVL